MKKTILLSFLLFTITVNAQLFSNFGFKLGYTSSVLTFDEARPEIGNEYPEHSRKGGFNFSIFGESKITPNIFIVSGLEYSQKGFTTNGGLRDTVRFHVISLEVLGKYKFNLGIVNPFITIGPRIDYLGGLERDLEYQGEDLFFDWAWIDTYNTFNFGGTISAGLEFDITEDKSLFIEFSYKPDITDMVAEDNQMFSNVKNKAIDISAGMIF